MAACPELHSLPCWHSQKWIKESRLGAKISAKISMRSLASHSFKTPSKMFPPYSIVVQSLSMFSIDTTASNIRNEPAFQQSSAQMTSLNAELAKVRDLFAQGGGPEGMESHTKRNKKLFVKERLIKLFDSSESHFELATLAGLSMPYGDIPRAGVVAAIGKVSDRLTLVLANDATVKGGTVFPITVRKQLRYLDLAKHLRIPCIYVVDSGGAFLPLQADIFPDANHGGRVFYNEAILSSLGVPQMSIVCGNCTAGGAYVPAMCEQMGMVQGIGQLFLGGPPLVLAATGEVISAEDLGGARVHSTVSGVSDHWFPDEDAAFHLTREVWDTLPQQMNSHMNRVAPQVALYPSDDLDGLSPQLWQSNCTNKEDALALGKQCITHIISRIVDKSHLVEFKATYGPGLITGFSRIDGLMCGLVAGYGVLCENALTKLAHFVQICQHRQLPIVFLVHTCSAGNKSDKYEEIKARGQAMFAVATATVPKLTLVVGDAFHEDYYCLGAPAMNSEFTFAWPNARFGYHDNIASSEQSKEKTFPVLNAFQAAGRLLIDDVISPSESRQCLAKALQICHTKMASPTSGVLQARQDGGNVSNMVYRF